MYPHRMVCSRTTTRVCPLLTPPGRSYNPLSGDVDAAFALALFITTAARADDPRPALLERRMVAIGFPASRPSRPSARFFPAAPSTTRLGRPHVTRPGARSRAHPRRQRVEFRRARPSTRADPPCSSSCRPSPPPTDRPPLSAVCADIQRAEPAFLNSIHTTGAATAGFTNPLGISINNCGRPTRPMVSRASARPPFSTPPVNHSPVRPIRRPAASMPAISRRECPRR